MNITAAAHEVHDFIKDLVKQWVDFRGHEENIAKIIGKHVQTVPYAESAFTEPSGQDIRAVELRRNNAYVWAANGDIWRIRIDWDQQPIIELVDRDTMEQ